MVTQFELVLGIVLIGITFICTLFVIITAVSKVNPRSIFPLTSVLLLWFGLIFLFAAKGFFKFEKPSPIPVAIAIYLPVIFGGILIARSAFMQKILFSIPQRSLVLLHAARFIGAMFIWFYLTGKLPPTFALTAGIGDCLVASFALTSVFILKKNPNAKIVLWILNVLGIIDLLMAVSLGTLSSEGPQRLIFETPPSNLIAELPLLLIPGFGVPFIALIHVISVMKLRRESE